MGIIIDGTYTALDKLYAYFKSAEGTVVIPSVQAIARSVGSKTKAAEDGLDEITELLPNDLKAPVKKLGVKSALGGILIVLCVIGAVAKAGADFSTIYKNLSPSLPTAPTIIIHNDPTNINSVTAGQSEGRSVAQPLKREQARRLKQMKARKDKLARKGKAEPQEECQPRRDPKSHLD